MPTITTGPPLNLLLPDIGSTIDVWGPILNQNFVAINTWAASLGAVQVFDLIGTPDGVSVNTFVSPIALPGPNNCAILYNGQILRPGGTPGVDIGFSLSGSNNTLVVLTFFPEVGASLRVMVI